MRAQASLEFLLIGGAVAAMCLFLIGFYSRNLFSQTSALAAMANAIPNSTYQQPLFLFNFSPTTSTTTIAYGSYSASITNRQEKLAYGMGSPSYIENLSQFSHCVQLGFFGHAYNISIQCGTTNAWDYFAGYDCWQNGVYCIIPQNTTYATASVSGQRSYIYNFTLVLDSQLGAMSSQIGGGENHSPITLNGQVVGYARVESVTSADPLPSATLLKRLSNYSVANQTYLSLYTQYRNTLWPVLAFYNNSGVDGATQQAIEQEMGSYASSQVHLIGSAGTAPACEASDSEYVCNATTPFLYLINVTLSPSLGQVNQTVYYLGSVISVRS